MHHRKIREISASEAAECVEHGQTLACSGFSLAGNPKKIPVALARRAERLHAEGKPFKVKLFAGASVGDLLDGQLSRAGAVSRRMPYQSNPSMRDLINDSQIAYVDSHLSHFPQQLAYGFLGELDWLIVEVCDFSDDGELVLSSSVGAVPTFCRMAKRILIELNTFHPKELRGIHDIYIPENPPHRQPIPLRAVGDRIGAETVRVDPAKIVGFVPTSEPDEVQEFKESNGIYEKISEHIAQFLIREMEEGRVPSSFLPLQSGVGNVANGVLAALGRCLPPFQMYSEVVQNAVIDLIVAGRIRLASASALVVTSDYSKRIYGDLKFFKERLILRPQEIANHPEILRRLGVISINTALEVDLFGHVNSTHLFGSGIVNGIGGSGDFTRNGYISIFVLPSVAKEGRISSLVPMCSHVDHIEHDVQVVATEWGVADLRGKDPSERAREIIEKCAHPDYRPILRHSLENGKKGHIRQNLSEAFRLHRAYLENGDMRLV